MVAIKDMEMPRWCGECEMCKEETIDDETITYCILLNQDITWNGNRVDNCPLVEIEEHKHGKWILHEENSASSSYHCSVCNRFINVLWSEELSDFPYCHCGAEMEISEDGKWISD